MKTAIKLAWFFLFMCDLSINWLPNTVQNERVSKNVGFHSKFTFETINVSDYVKV